MTAGQHTVTILVRGVGDGHDSRQKSDLFLPGAA
jgi:hypothetical protein